MLAILSLFEIKFAKFCFMFSAVSSKFSPTAPFAASVANCAALRLFEAAASTILSALRLKSRCALTEPIYFTSSLVITLSPLFSTLYISKPL